MLGIVLPAAGSGIRFGGEKVLAPVGGRPLVFHTLERLAHLGGEAGTVLVLPRERIAAIRAEHGRALAARGVVAIVAGGALRQDSVRAGLAALPPDADTVLVTDAVRPLFSVEAARRAVAEARRGGAAVVGVPARDTLKRVDVEPAAAGARGREAVRVVETVPREEIWHAETPQVFSRAVLLAAFRRAEEDGFAGTDEASLVERLGHPVVMVRGGPFNVKVTEPEDLSVVEALLGREREA